MQCTNDNEEYFSVLADEGENEEEDATVKDDEVRQSQPATEPAESSAEPVVTGASEAINSNVQST